MSVICIKCGMTASSKCPYCRSIFPDNQMDALLSYFLKFYFRDGKFYVVLEDGEKKYKGSETKALSDLARLLHLMAQGAPINNDPKYCYPTIEEYTCDHEWCFNEGVESSIDCGHGWSQQDESTNQKIIELKKKIK